MLVSHRKQFIYLKTKKTASTSVESFFERWCFAPDEWTPEKFRDETETAHGIVGYRGVKQKKWLGLKNRRWFDHMSAEQVKRQLPRETWDSYFKFCVIRNPFDKVISAFHFFAWMEERGFHKMAVQKKPDATDITWFREWVEVAVAQKHQVVDREIYTIDGELCVDFVVRYESLQEDLSLVCNRIGIGPDFEQLPNLVGGVRPTQIPISDYYDRATADIVAEAFAFELAEFGYAKPV